MTDHDGVLAAFIAVGTGRSAVCLGAFCPQAVAQLEESMLIGWMFFTHASFTVARYGFNTGWSAALNSPRQLFLVDFTV